MKSSVPDFNRHPAFCIRLSPEEKARFKAAADADGKALGTWFKWLARERVTEQERRLNRCP
jgi:hypothetical protein